VSRLTVELKHDLNWRGEDAACLETLIEGRPHVGVFLSNAWLSGFFAEPPAGSTPVLVLLREGTALRGMAPIAVRHRRTHVRVSLLGGGQGSDRIDLLAARGFEAVCSDTFLSRLGEVVGRKAFVLELRDVPADSPLWGAVQRAAIERTQALALQPREVHTLPYLDLADSWPSATTGAARGPALDKHRRWLERRHPLRIELLTDPGEVADALAALARFLHARWHGHGAGSVLDDPRVLRFHQQALPLLLAEGRLRMVRLSADSRTIAVFYGLGSGGWWGYYLAGYDRAWARRIHLGQITLATAIEVAAQEKASEFDFLKGAERVKYLWPVRERATVDADLYSGTAGAQLARATRATGDVAVAFGKVTRDLFRGLRCR
jgi:CelD/BcsL family acetyltransferase involved in cellulose biosynthesis